MSQNSQKTFAIHCPFASSSDGRTKQTLVAGDRTFNLPALAINPLVKSTFHLTTVFACGPFPTSTPFVQRDDRRANPQLLSAKSMVMLSVVGRIGQKPIQRQVLRGQSHSFGKIWRIIAGPTADHRRDKQMTGSMANNCELRPTPTSEAFISYTLNVISADSSTLQTGGVNSSLRTLINQAALAGMTENSSEQFMESPFFSSRRSA